MQHAWLRRRFHVIDGNAKVVMSQCAATEDELATSFDTSSVCDLYTSRLHCRNDPVRRNQHVAKQACHIFCAQHAHLW